MLLLQLSQILRRSLPCGGRETCNRRICSQVLRGSGCVDGLDSACCLHCGAIEKQAHLVCIDRTFGSVMLRHLALISGHSLPIDKTWLRLANHFRRMIRICVCQINDDLRRSCMHRHTFSFCLQCCSVDYCISARLLHVNSHIGYLFRRGPSSKLLLYCDRVIIFADLSRPSRSPCGHHCGLPRLGKISSRFGLGSQSSVCLDNLRPLGHWCHG